MLRASWRWGRPAWLGVPEVAEAAAGDHAVIVESLLRLRLTVVVVDETLAFVDEPGVVDLDVERADRG